MEGSKFYHCRDSFITTSVLSNREGAEDYGSRDVPRWQNTIHVGKIPDRLQWPTLEARREHLSLSFCNKTDISTVSI